MARPDFRAAAARRLSEDRELSPAIVSLISSDNAGRTVGVRVIPVDRIESNPQQPRMVFDADALAELSASIREHVRFTVPVEIAYRVPHAEQVPRGAKLRRQVGEMPAIIAKQVDAREVAHDDQVRIAVVIPVEE